MRQITKDAVSALLGGREFSRGNTSVVRSNIRAWEMKVHEESIAYNFDNSPDTIYLSVSTNGLTKTSKERLNGIPNVKIVQRGGMWYLNGERWGGDAIAVYINKPFDICKNILAKHGISSIKYNSLPNSVKKRLERDFI